MRTQEQVEFQYRNYLKFCAKHREEYEAAYSPYDYAYYKGSVYALGFTLGKSIKEIGRELERAERKNR